MRRARGFTLIEMVVVIAVMGLLMTMLVGISRVFITKERYTTTRTRLANVETALAVFVSTNKRLPCPADGRLASGAADTVMNKPGKEVVASISGTPPIRLCGNSQQYGVVPWRDLGLTATDVEDGWGGRFTYRVGTALVSDNAMDFTACDPAGGAGAAASPPPYCSSSCSSTNISACTTPANALDGTTTPKGLVVESVAGTLLMNPRNNPTTGAAYVLISHGPEGGGSYDGNGNLQSSTVSAGTMEAKNFANVAWADPPASPGVPTVYLVDDVTNSTATTAHFDDLIARTGVLALAMKAQVGPRSH